VGQIEEAHERESTAAVRIQAGVRGFLKRKSLIIIEQQKLKEEEKEQARRLSTPSKPRESTLLGKQATEDFGDRSANKKVYSQRIREAQVEQAAAEECVKLQRREQRAKRKLEQANEAQLRTAREEEARVTRDKVLSWENKKERERLLALWRGDLISLEQAREDIFEIEGQHLQTTMQVEFSTKHSIMNMYLEKAERAQLDEQLRVAELKRSNMESGMVTMGDRETKAKSHLRELLEEATGVAEALREERAVLLMMTNNFIILISSIILVTDGFDDPIALTFLIIHTLFTILMSHTILSPGRPRER
jgi:hypothetical protein